MTVYLIAFKAHPADDSPAEARRAELRAGAFRSIVERRFAPEQRRQISATCFFVHTSESLVTLTAFTESPDELYIAPLAAPLHGRSPDAIDTHGWLASRLPGDARADRV